ncbi:PRC-barrel domain-containing protein [Dactylosporangium salmoneum]|uniref:PRC-barrel domain-containing protein n=1 Tax=Dactylosporangium salmoneum TaxID=53361 RepID=A0ABN3G571_9ACTN
MTRLMRARELIGMAVVTLDGDDIADVKDVVFDGDTGHVRGFTLNGRGLLAGPLDKGLPAGAVSGVGRDAVMAESPSATVALEDIVPRARTRDSDVLGDHVLTETGTDLGAVADVILEVAPGGVADVVGYEIVSSAALYPDGRHVLLPLPHTVAASGEAVVVPSEAVRFVRHDLSEFASAITAFRHRREEEREEGDSRGQGGGGDAVQ